MSFKRATSPSALIFSTLFWHSSKPKKTKITTRRRIDRKILLYGNEFECDDPSLLIDFFGEWGSSFAKRQSEKLQWTEICSQRTYLRLNPVEPMTMKISALCLRLPSWYYCALSIDTPNCLQTRKKNDWSKWSTHWDSRRQKRALDSQRKRKTRMFRSVKEVNLHLAVQQKRIDNCFSSVECKGNRNSMRAVRRTVTSELQQFVLSLSVRLDESRKKPSCKMQPLFGNISMESSNHSTRSSFSLRWLLMLDLSVESWWSRAKDVSLDHLRLFPLRSSLFQCAPRTQISSIDEINVALLWTRKLRKNHRFRRDTDRLTMQRMRIGVERMSSWTRLIKVFKERRVRGDTPRLNELRIDLLRRQASSIGKSQSVQITQKDESDSLVRSTSVSKWKNSQVGSGETRNRMGQPGKEILKVPLFRRLIFRCSSSQIKIDEAKWSAGTSIRCESRWISNCWWRGNNSHWRRCFPWRNPMTNATIPRKTNQICTSTPWWSGRERERRILLVHRTEKSIQWEWRKRNFHVDRSIPWGSLHNNR